MQNKPMSRIVLVMVDDDEDDCLLVEAALYEALLKCDFHCVEDGLEMMDFLNCSGRFQDPASAPRPDIILLDLNMPRMNGIAVLEKVKTDPRFRAIPVIVLTTSREDEDVVACYELGANTYITKQPSFTGLVSAIKAFKEYWLETATLPAKSDPLKRKKEKLSSS
jgi:CheY-like chemotaxis protein